jgi:hypothetical protein
MRTQLSLLAIVSATALAACGANVSDSNASGTTSGGNTGGGVTTGSNAGGGNAGGGGQGGGSGGTMVASYPAPHPSEPQIPNHGGVTLHDPVIVTVTWPNDSMESTVETFDDTIGTFAWWPTWANDYGVGPATGGGHVPLTEAAPTTISDDEIQTWLDGKIQDGTMPAPTDQTIYALYYPSSTTVTIPQQEGGGSSCSSFLGYHNSYTTTFMGQSIPIAYAVINRCGGQDTVTETASHEFAEAATDPHPLQGGLAYMILSDNPWTVAGGEVGDMCSQVGGVTEQGYSLTRVWSNSAALKGDQPCVPNPDPSMPFFDAGLEHDTLSASPGQTVTTKVDCYSFGPLPNAMTLQAQPYSPQTITITFDKPTCVNGDVVTMSVAVGPNAMHATDYHYDILAQLDPMTAHVWRGMVQVQ